MSNEQELLIETSSDVVIVSLNRPDYRNAMTMAMYDGLAEICKSPPENARAMIIRGAGEAAFAAGTDIRQFRDFSTAQHSIDYEHKMDRILGAIEVCPIPTIAAIAGACTGGGAIIAGACDIRITAANLKYGFPIARTLGNCLSVASIARMENLIGAGRLREIIFTSRLIGAEEARQIGLVSEVHDGAAQTFDRAIELARHVAGQAPLTLRATKILQQRLMMQSARQIDDADMVQLCYLSDDFKNGLEAFLAKRKPQWRGK